MERNKIIQELIIAQRQIEQVGSKPALETIKRLLKTLAAETANEPPTAAATPCDHQFVGNDYLCKKCGLYFPETNG
jgi:hypothetical protein